ncbi:ABC transporter permease [Streptomyces sp. BE20]|uniref:ABC transporter permease n=1 Tax=Streptomycetaceae TaxID=2062 RepID=UPI002E77F8AD|nr:ABC transporter permease [Streptomyces sp. BE20]MEE1824429.1 ABC transporter permease [Streptomyces sp. BE20]
MAVVEPVAGPAAEPAPRTPPTAPTRSGSQDPGPAPDRAPAPASLLRRVCRDRTGAVSLAVVLLFLLLAVAAPLIAALYGKNPTEHYGQNTPGLLSDGGLPVAPNGGISGEFWFGLEPGLGRDVLTQLLYGIRTSLLIAFVAAAVTTTLGVLAGVAVGYLGGITDRLFGFLSNVLLAFPTLLLLLAISPVIQSRLVDPGTAEPDWMQFLVLILVFSAFGWIPLALSLRATVRSLRERDFVQSARAMGASGFHIVFRELLPNVRAQLLVHATMAVPTFVASEAVLSFLGVGINEPIPDWGRMISRGSEVFQADPTYMFFPGIALLLFVLAFNLLGDAVRDALDPRSAR